MRTTLIAALLTVTLLASAGCGGTTEVVCEPPCPANTTCTENGCISSTPNPDIAMAPQPDLAGMCLQNCGGATPYCRGNLCVPCLTDDHCPSGQICMAVGASAICVPGCADDTRCKGAGQHCCKGACVDTNVDVRNCGGCGTVCGGQNSTAKCAAGACVPGACNSGWGDCNADAKDGCETNLRTNVNHCTGCGMKCDIKNAISGCSDAEKPPCYIAACKFGWDDCNGDPKDGCETNVLADIKNCGACGMPCAVKPNAQVSCINATCQLTSCVQGFLDCDGSPANGCEINIGTDAANCGGCKRPCGQGLVCKGQQCTCPMCNIPNASALCVNNQCVFDKCNPGYTDCNNNQQDGCEVVTDSDAKNCGGCGAVCPMNLPACVSGMCTNSTHAVLQLAWDFNAPLGGCGDSSAWWTQNLGMMTFDQCELQANKYGAQYMGMTGSFPGYNAPYGNMVRWVGEADANNGYIGTAGWNVVNQAPKGNAQNCVLAYANDKQHGNGTFQQMMTSNNGKAYFVNDYGSISEKVCYTNALAAGARPLNPYMFAQAQKGAAHMVENHTCHGSVEYTGAPGTMSDGAANHTYKCFLGYNP